MVRVILVRLAIAAVTFLGASMAIYFGIAAIPGDPGRFILGPAATPQSVQLLDQQMGLDRPIVDRYGTWLGHFVTGNLGEAFATGEPQPVWPLIRERVANTLILAGLTLAFLVPLAVGLGIVSAVRRGRWLDNVIMSTTLTFVAVPEFVVGTLFILLFAIWEHWLPAISLLNPSRSALVQPQYLALPMLTLLAHAVAGTTRMVRACMIDVLRSDYVEMARLKGLNERAVLLRHALPNALGPTIQVLALNAAWLVGGIVIVETVFQYPGVGSYLTSAVSSYDVTTVEAIGMLITVVYVVMNMIANLSVVLLNPRLRRQR